MSTTSAFEAESRPASKLAYQVAAGFGLTVAALAMAMAVQSTSETKRTAAAETESIKAQLATIERERKEARDIVCRAAWARVTPAMLNNPELYSPDAYAKHNVSEAKTWGLVEYWGQYFNEFTCAARGGRPSDLAATSHTRTNGHSIYFSVDPMTGEATSFFWPQPNVPTHPPLSTEGMPQQRMF